MKKLFIALPALVLLTSTAVAESATVNPPGLNQFGGVAPASTNADPLGTGDVEQANDFTPAGIKG